MLQLWLPMEAIQDTRKAWTGVATSSLPKCHAATGQDSPAIERLGFADGMRVAASIAVIALHCAAPGLRADGNLGTDSWRVCATVGTATRWCVPVFVMLSGALLLDPRRQETLVGFYSRRWKRIVPPLIIWSVLYACWNCFYRDRQPPSLYYLKAFLDGRPHYHLHFLFIILGLYMIAPMLQIYVRHSARRDQWCICVLLLSAAAAGTSYSRLVEGESLNAFSRFVPFVGYFLAGYLLRDAQLTVKHLIGLVATWALTVPVLVFGTYRLSQCWPLDVDRAMALCQYLSPIVVVQSIAAYLVLMHVFSTGVCGLHIPIAALGPLTFGIYLVHAAVLDVIQHILQSHYLRYPVVSIAVQTTLTFALSALLSFGLRKLPKSEFLTG